jgi:hypothetical protein
MGKQKQSVLDLLSKTRRRRELETQQAVWKTFGVDYEAEKAKQHEIWNALQRKRQKGKTTLQRRYIRKFLRDLKKIDVKKKPQETVADLEKLAELTHKYSEDENLGLLEMLKWAHIETHIYRLIFNYDVDDVIKLRETVMNELGA